MPDSPLHRHAWIMPKSGQIELLYLDAERIADLEARGYKAFSIDCERSSPIIGYAEDEQDVAELRSLLHLQSQQSDSGLGSGLTR